MKPVTLDQSKLVLNSFCVLLLRDLSVMDIRWGSTSADNILNDVTTTFSIGAFDEIVNIATARESTGLATAAARMGAQIRAMALQSDMLLTGKREFPAAGSAMRRDLPNSPMSIMMRIGGHVEFSIPVMGVKAV